MNTFFFKWTDQKIIVSIKISSLQVATRDLINYVVLKLDIFRCV